MNRMLHIGYSNYVNLDKVVSIVDSNSMPSRRLVNEAAQINMLIEANHGKKTATLIIIESGHVIKSAIDRKTLIKRINEV